MVLRLLHVESLPAVFHRVESGKSTVDADEPDERRVRKFGRVDLDEWSGGVIGPRIDPQYRALRLIRRSSSEVVTVTSSSARVSRMSTSSPGAPS